MSLQQLKTIGSFFKQASWNLGLITAGSILCAVTVNGLLIPHEFLTGGVLGLAMLPYYISPTTMPLALIYLLLNVPLFLLGWFYVGRRFFLYSLAGMLIYTATIKWIHPSFSLTDPILVAIFAGIVNGLGSGIILRSQGSAGGTDILSVILLKRYSIRLGSTVLVFNTIVLSTGALLLSMERALYTMVYMFVMSWVLNVTVNGWSQRRAIFIISPAWETISRCILEEDTRWGVTIIEGRGAYAKQEQNILYTVIPFHELPDLKRLIRQYDPNAFVVVTDTMEVMGHRMGNQPHW